MEKKTAHRRDHDKTKEPKATAIEKVSSCCSQPSNATKCCTQDQSSGENKDECCTQPADGTSCCDK